MARTTERELGFCWKEKKNQGKGIPGKALIENLYTGFVLT